MCINKSQQFIYFQNKAKHYDNIKKMKPIVQDHLHPCYIKNNNNKKRFIPYNIDYQIQSQNQGIVNRLNKISQSPRSQVKAQGNYSRYYLFDRSFRKRNPYKNQANRQIQLENSRFSKKLDKVQPSIGTISLWNQNHQNNINHRQNLSRYNQNQKSKGSVLISTQSFVPKHYQSFIAHQTLQPLSDRKTIKVSKQKLIKLPYLERRQNSQSPLKNIKSRSTLG